jgi:hypothetical protein
MEKTMNVVNLVEVKNREETDNAVPNRDDRDVLESMWWGLEHSVHAKDPDNPNAPGSINFFMKHICDQAPTFYLSLIAKYMEPPKD